MDQIAHVRPAGACLMTGEKGMRYGMRQSLKRSRPRDRDRIGRPQPLVRRHREGRATARGLPLTSASRETCQQTRREPDGVSSGAGLALVPVL